MLRGRAESADPALAASAQFERDWSSLEDCFITHYDQYKVDAGCTDPSGHARAQLHAQLHVHGDMTMAENMADMLGMQVQACAW